MHDSVDAGKAQAAQVAASLVENGMRVGLGTGSTAALVVESLIGRWRGEGLRFVGVPTSRATAEQARAGGLELVELDAVDELDLAIDGADEVDGAFRMIKGRGGALLREKIVASSARRRAIVVTENKLVSRLGQDHPVPVEVSAFGLEHTAKALRALGASTAVRRGPDGSPYLTDEGHRIIDCRFEEIDDPAALNVRLNALVGVFETGLFIGLCDVLVVGGASGVRRLEADGDRST